MQRLVSVDVFRILAITAVIALHTAKYTGPDAIGATFDILTFLSQCERFAVPFFFVLSGYFWSEKIKDGAIWSRSFEMSKRLLTVFCGWAAIYLLVLTIQSFTQHGIVHSLKLFYWAILPRNAGFLNWMFEGPRPHLWYLTALIFSVLISASFIAAGRRHALALFALLLFSVGLAGKAYSLTPIGFISSFNFRNGPFFSLALFVTGIYLHHWGTRRWWLPAGLAATGIGLCVQSLETLWLHEKWGTSLIQDYVIGTYVFGVGVAVTALSNAEIFRLPRLAAIAPLVLGVYAGHYLFVDLLRPIDRAIPANLMWEALYIALVLVLSLALSAILAKIPITRKFVM